MKKIFIALFVALIVITNYSVGIAKKTTFDRALESSTTKTTTYEPVFTPSGLKFNALTSIETTEISKRSTEKSINGTNLVITFTMWRAIRGSTSWSGSFSAWVEGKSTLNIQADYIHVFVKHYYGNPGSCNLSVANGEKTAYNASEAFAGSPKYIYKKGLQHCVKYAEHDAVYSSYGGGSFHYMAMDDPSGILP